MRTSGAELAECDQYQGQEPDEAGELGEVPGQDDFVAGVLKLQSCHRPDVVASHTRPFAPTTARVAILHP